MGKIELLPRKILLIVAVVLFGAIGSGLLLFGIGDGLSGQTWGVASIVCTAIPFLVACILATGLYIGSFVPVKL